MKKQIAIFFIVSLFLLSTSVYAATGLFSEDWESGEINQAYWNSTGTNQYRTFVNDAHPSGGGNFALQMDDSVDDSTYSGNFVYTKPIFGKDNQGNPMNPETLEIAFNWSHANDEFQACLNIFGSLGYGDCLVLSCSNSPVSWKKLQDLNPSFPTDTWKAEHLTVNLDAVCGNVPHSNILVGFRHYDNFGIYQDGFFIDKIFFLWYT